MANPLSLQIAALGRALGQFDESYIVTPAQREELVEMLAIDLCEGMRRLARVVGAMEAELSALKSRPSADIVDLSHVFARKQRDRGLTVIEGGAQ